MTARSMHVNHQMSEFGTAVASMVLTHNTENLCRAPKTESITELLIRAVTNILFINADFDTV